MTRKITCISCPIGCYLTVTLKAGQELQVSGNQCKRGVAYAQMECTNPTRMMTSTVRLTGSPLLGQLPVKSSAPLPKDLVAESVNALKGVALAPPVYVGDVVVANILGTGVDIVATREVLSEQRNSATA